MHWGLPLLVVMQFDEEREVALMFGIYSNRPRNDEEPAPGTACLTRSIFRGDVKAISQEMERRLLQKDGSK